MEYMISVVCLYAHHVSRSIAGTMIPSMQWVRGEHAHGLAAGGTLLCISCRLCAVHCSSYCISLTVGITACTRTPTTYSIHYGWCIHCSLCDGVCPVGAIHHTDGIYSTTTARTAITSSLRMLVL
uniref:NADH dehydrogenase subunit 8 n=1 Tax=Rhynchopus euleeides TaxID=630703 RepID=A0A2D2AJW1_9EUGL|nr:NADH dehydrogenase subunit 8 [Rhynchopus euleeides]